ncbi:MAG: PH domain-containing protein [Planctomycetota bacterium]
MKTDADEFHRLHPSSLIFGIGGQAKSYIVPGLAVFFLASDNRWELFAMLLFLPSAAWVVVRFLSFRYRLAEFELITKSGIFNRVERHIPYARIQNINLVQNPFHRMVRVAKVQLETASGEDPEAEMNVLGLDQVAAIRSRVFAHKQAQDSKTESDQAQLATEPVAASSLTTPTSTSSDESVDTLVKLSLGDLLFMGLLSNAAFAAFAAAFGLAAQSGVDYEQWIADHVMSLIDHGWEDRSEMSPWQKGFLYSAFGIFGFIILKLLSAILIVFRYGGFQLVKHGDDLRFQFGLTTRRSGTIPRRRIQVLGRRAGLIQRYFGRFELRAQTAGANDGKEGIGRTPLVPLAKEPEFRPLLQALAPDLVVEQPAPFKPAPKRRRRRQLRKRIILPLFLVAAVAWWSTPWVMLALPVLWFFGVLQAIMQHRNFGWKLEDAGLWVRQGWPRVTTGIVPYSRIQTIEVQQSYFDRRWRLASVYVDTAAGGGASIPLTMDELDERTADALRKELHARAAAEKFVWN